MPHPHTSSLAPFPSLAQLPSARTNLQVFFTQDTFADGEDRMSVEQAGRVLESTLLKSARDHTGR